jgi:hypothetical protein
MDNSKPKEEPKITDHNKCTTNSAVFGTVKECKFKKDSDSESEYNSDSNLCTANFCISCGENLGEHNPRQYCNKLYCPYEN